jgi:hypothetical protein
VDDAGLSILKAHLSAVRVAWNDIQEILAYKKDLLTEDVICFDLKIVNHEMSLTYTLNEEMEGFSEAEKALENCLPYFDKTWRTKVVKPAFASNCVRIFSRE